MRGSYPTRVDDKGRLKVPAEFKRVLGDGMLFYITSQDGRRAQAYPVSEWEKKEEALAKMPPSHPVRQKFQDVTSYYGQTVEMDSTGRLLLPQLLREEAKLTGEVVVMGKVGFQASGSASDPRYPGFLEIVNHDEFKGQIKSAPIDAGDTDVLVQYGV